MRWLKGGGLLGEEASLTIRFISEILIGVGKFRAGSIRVGNRAGKGEKAVFGEMDSRWWQKTFPVDVGLKSSVGPNLGNEKKKKNSDLFGSMGCSAVSFSGNGTCMSGGDVNQVGLPYSTGNQDLKGDCERGLESQG